MIIRCQLKAKLHNECILSLMTIMKDSCYVSVVLDPNVKLSSFDEETALKVRRFLHDIYSRYVDEQSDSNLIVTKDCNTSRNYFKNISDVLLETIGVIF